MKKNVPHIDALDLIATRSDPTVLLEFRILGLFTLVELIQREKHRIAR